MRGQREKVSMFCVRAGATAALCFSSFAVSGVLAEQFGDSLTATQNSRPIPRYVFGAQILSTSNDRPLTLEMPAALNTVGASTPAASQWTDARLIVDTYLSMHRTPMQPEYTVVQSAPSITATDGLLVASTRMKR
jgi:hypothetical protein